MRTKSFLIFISCVFVTTVFLIVFGPQQSDSIHNIVTSTHQQIRNFQDNLRDAEQKNLVADEKYLAKICLTAATARVYPNRTWNHNTSLPTLVTYVRDGQQSQAIGLIINVSKVLINTTILVYDLGLSTSGLQTLKNYCNSTHCQVVNFDLSSFPSHVDKDTGHAFRPLVIQDALCKTGAVIFLENHQRLTKHASATKLQSIYQNILTNHDNNGDGILAWPMQKAVSSLTHPKMFDYFHTERDPFCFLKMLKLDRLIVINSLNVHQNIMLPWVQCALTIDCILPIGAQSTGCRFDKKPNYRYSGCHNYDVSALSIVLGLSRSNESRYLFHGSSKPERLFIKVSLDSAVTELTELERNSTVAYSESSSLVSNIITSS